jgi:hypothetical protein
MQDALFGGTAVAAALLALPGLLFSQAIEVAPKAVKLMQVEGGPLALAKVSIRPPARMFRTGRPPPRTGIPTTPGFS